MTSGNKMTKIALLSLYLSLLLIPSAPNVLAQTSASTHGQAWLQPVPAFPLADNPITLRQSVQPRTPMTVAGECGAFLGQQDGSLESWIFPVKLFSHFAITARLDGYDVPIDVNGAAAEIEVAPDHTTITYTHIAFTLKEILFATPCDQQDGTGLMALFQLSAIRPMSLTFSLIPELKPMWPAPVSASVDPEWIKVNMGHYAPANDFTRPGANSTENPAGWYILHTDFNNLAGAIAMPGTEPGVLAPYQEEPKDYPLQMVLHFDPKRDTGHYFPLLMAVGNTAASATEEALAAKLAALNRQAAALYQKNADHYSHFFDTRLTVQTPDVDFDRDMQWAAISIDQVRVRHGNEVGMVAGFFSSGSSARPGYGWFFGRDTLYTTWGINNYGDFGLTRQALTFLIKRQRDDGKMPHEFSQTAEQVDWAHLGYEYAAADATPLFIMAMEDYVKSSGDMQFLRDNWSAIEKAWTFEITHDSDGDGIYDNSQGTAWVESWPQGMPHQEIYLASLDQQASTAMAMLSDLTDHASETASAAARAATIATKINTEYTQPSGMYAFSYNANHTQDKAATIYPAIAWWAGSAALPKADAMFSRWASHEFSTDWGTRDVGENDPVYDPISYHQGSMWPLFTGWASIAEYRTGRDLAGYTHLMQNANLTTQQDLGAVTELLSGAYFTPFGRSTSHQMWSSAMVLVPAVRGLFGVSVDALKGVVTVDPHLPANWPSASLHHLQVGSESVNLRYERHDGEMMIRLEPAKSKLKLASRMAGAKISHEGKELNIPLPAVEIAMSYGANDTLPLPGAATQKMKVLSEERGVRSLTLTLEAQGGSTQTLLVHENENRLHLAAEGGQLGPGAENGEPVKDDEILKITFPTGAGYQPQRVTLRW